MSMIEGRRRLVTWVIFTALLALMVGCNDASAPGDPGGDGGVDGGSGPPASYLALVSGTPFTTDLAMVQAAHDPIANGGREDAMAAGDFGHEVFLGTTLLGTTENDLTIIDRWDNVPGMGAFYSNPAFADAVGGLFDGPPTLETFEAREDFHTWGSFDAADAEPDRYFVVVRGRLASTDTETNRAAHDAVAAGGETAVRAAGDVAHVVYLGLEDPQEFLAIDIWADPTNIVAVYSDPDFAAAFGSLFESAPTLGVYASTDWAQW